MTRATRIALSSALWVATVRLLMRRDGATQVERDRHYPGDDLVSRERKGSTMAVTIDAPPSAVWPWLVQMGNDRGGFYSWDRLDNGGDPSAEEIHSEWQRLREGDRIAATPDGRIWFSVKRLVPERTLVLWSRVDYLRMRSLEDSGECTALCGYGIWAFHLESRDGGSRTRLIVRARGGFCPHRLAPAFDWLVFDFAHWFMQARQLRNLKRRAEALTLAPAVDRPEPLVASRG
jgi:hypothetical protein